MWQLRDPSATAVLTGGVVATTLQLVPEQLDLLSFVLTMAGASALSGSAFGLARGTGNDGRGRYSEQGAILAAAAGLALFVVLYFIQEVL